MPNNTISVYLTKTLYERVKDAQAEGKFKASEVCRIALEDKMREIDQPNSQEQQVTTPSDPQTAPPLPPSSEPVQVAPRNAEEQAYIDRMQQQQAAAAPEPEFVTPTFPPLVGVLQEAEITIKASIVEAQAYIDNALVNGGYCQSISVQIDGSLLLLIYWTKL